MTVTFESGGCCGRSIWSRRSVCRNFNDCPPASKCADITFVSSPDISSGDDGQSKMWRKSLSRFAVVRRDFMFCNGPCVIPYMDSAVNREPIADGAETLLKFRLD